MAGGKRYRSSASRAPSYYNRAGAQRTGAKLRRMSYVPYGGYSGRNAPRARFRATQNRRTGGFLGIEYKFYDTSVVASAIVSPSDAAGGEQDQSATICATTITQGDGEQQRDGRKVVVKNIYINGTVSTAALVNQTAMKVAPIVYIAMVQDKQTNGATIVSENVFKNIGANGILAASPLRNLQESSRYRVLAKVQLDLKDPEASYDGTNIEIAGTEIPFSLSWSGMMNILYKATTETIANTVDNSVHVIAYCSNTGLVPLLNYNCRTRFVG